jgi:hypothetical protein
MSTQYRLVQSGKTASGGCSAGQGSSEPVAPRIYYTFATNFILKLPFLEHTNTKERKKEKEVNQISIFYLCYLSLNSLKSDVFITFLCSVGHADISLCGIYHINKSMFHRPVSASYPITSLSQFHQLFP